MPAWIDITGHRYGRLTVISFKGMSIHHKSLWLCRCDCGKEVITLGNSLRVGDRTSCGCMRRKAVRKANVSRRSKTAIKNTGYVGVHHRLARWIGIPSEFTCYGCNVNRAHDWALINYGPHTQDSKWGPYSIDLNDYIPMCRSCHKLHDKQMKQYYTRRD